NAAGMAALRQFVDDFPANRKTVVIGGTGDRRDVDIVELGAQTAEIFDDAIIREDDDLRGRAPGETADLVIQGIKQVNADFSYECILNSKESIEYALENAKQDDLIAILGGNSEEAIDLVGDYREKSLDSSISKDDIPNMSR
ncbi:MAG: cyanophycin synthetase, partial [Pseudomonadota bacterium]